MSIHWHDDEVGWCPCDEPDESWGVKRSHKGDAKLKAELRQIREAERSVDLNRLIGGNDATP